METNSINFETSFNKEEAYIRAKKKVDNIIGFYWHLAVFIFVNAIIIFLNANYNKQGFWSFGTFSTALFWGIGLLFHFLGVFGPDFLFGRNWEQKKIKEFMDKDRKNWQ